MDKPIFQKVTRSNGWKMVKFGDVVRNVNETERNPLEAGLDRYIGLEHIEPENLHIKSWGDLTTDEVSFTKRFRKGQVLFGKRRAYQRKVAVAEFDGICSSDILTFEPKDDTLLPELLPFLVQSDGFFEHALGTSSGSLSPRTRWSQLQDYEFSLPPKDEQRRIAEMLIAAQSLRQRISELMESVEILRNAILGEIRENGEFQRVSVGKVARFTSGKAIRVSELGERSSESPIPVFGGNGISGYTYSEMPTIENQVVIVGRVGQYCGCVVMADPPCWITDNALYSVEVSDQCDSSFLGLMLEASRLNRLKLGNYLPLINQKVLHSWKIPLPPLHEQERILKAERSLRVALSTATTQHEESIRLLKTLVNRMLGSRETSH